METIRIDLGNYKNNSSTVFTGRPQGKEVREKIGLDKIDKDNNKAAIFVVPEDTTSINPSFYLGLLYDSFKKLGIEGFKKKYSFNVLVKNAEMLNELNKNLADGFRNANNFLNNKSAFQIFSE
jgi:hypothetical protein